MLEGGTLPTLVRGSHTARDGRRDTCSDVRRDTARDGRRNTARDYLLYVAALLASLTALMLVFSVCSQARGWHPANIWSGWSHQRGAQLSQQASSSPGLPDLPQSDWQMAAQLFSYISQPSGATCRRQLRFGGSPSLRRHGMVVSLEGGQQLCLDPQLALTSPDCLVYSVRNAGDDRSLESALHRYGCEVHSFDGPPRPAVAEPLVPGMPSRARAGRGGAETAHQAALSSEVTLDDLRARAGHTDRQLALLSVTSYGGDELILSQLETLRSVQQLALRLDFTGALPRGERSVKDTFAAFRQRYEQLLVLQTMGFRLMSFDQLDGHGAVNMTVPGLSEPLTSVMELVLVNTEL